MPSAFCALAALLVTAGSQAAPSPAATSRDSTRGLHRWIDFQSGTIEIRYRQIESSAGETVANQIQHKQAFKGALKLDAAGHYTLQSSLGTGSNFIGSWDATGAGTGQPAWDFRVRRLFLQAVPISGVELSAGSFDTLRGQSTEITTLDNDAYVEGYRVSVKRPSRLHVDELAVTLAYLGDLNEPNVFTRLDRLSAHNYSQILVAKRWTLAAGGAAGINGNGRGRDEIAISFDWTALEGVDTLRQAIRLASHALTVVDGVRFEHYWRISGDKAYGFAIVVDKALTRRVTAAGGFSHTDRNFPPLNGDRYGRGKRLVAETRLALRPDLSLGMFYTNGFANDFPVAGNRRLDVLLSYNILKALQQAHRW